jgi:hypothetical protein
VPKQALSLRPLELHVACCERECGGFDPFDRFVTIYLKYIYGYFAARRCMAIEASKNRERSGNPPLNYPNGPAYFLEFLPTIAVVRRFSLVQNTDKCSASSVNSGAFEIVSQ